MSRPVSALGPQLHLPLSRLVLCCDCEACFELGSEACPACGSSTWTTLARFLDGGTRERPAVAMKRDRHPIGREH